MLRTGYIQDKRDPKDFLFGSLRSYRELEPVKPSVDYRDRVSIIFQEDLNSCVVHGGFGAIRLRHSLDGIPNPKLGCRMLGYWGARAYDGLEDVDVGSRIRNFFRFINVAGYMPEEDTDHGYDTSRFTEPPSRRETHEMFDQKNKSVGQVRYFRINTFGGARTQELKIALSNGFIPVLGAKIGPEFFDWHGGGPIDIPMNTPSWGHAFYGVGYDSYGLIFANSWEGWGESGFGRVTWRYVQSNLFQDIWVVERAPYFSGEIS